ncbi:ABC transporter substrate-binding protein [Streptomyces sp. NPDC056390]|uniref:ABC transporter substrate-binding protein n=1 Tax=Streptomyces sp. NPDC056390 TaxID=3345806 RepID=UPI0035D5CFFE
MTITRVAARSAACVLLVAVTACGAPVGESGSRDTLRVGFVTSNPTSLDPAKGTAGSDHTILWSIYDSLIRFDKDVNPEPSLAKSWKWVSPTHLRLDLVKGNKFQDGTAFDAEAVKFNLDRVRRGGKGITIASDLAAVKDVKVSGPLTVDITTSRPAASLLLTLSDRAGMMVSPAALRKNEAAVERHPVGAGAFTFTKWTPGDRIELRKAGTYWDAKSTKLDGISYRLMPDTQTRLNALQAGDIDFTYNVDPESFKGVENDARLAHESSLTLAYYQLFLNLGKKPFDDIRVRRAVAMAIDREALVKAVLGDGGGEAAWMPVPSAHWAYTPSLKGKPAYDPAAAKRLLAQAGHAHGLSFDVAFETGSLNERRAEIIKSSLAKVGITVNLRPNDTATTTAAFIESQSVQALNNRWTGRPDPATTYFAEFSENGFTNVGHFVDKDLDAALRAGESGRDQAARVAAYAKANKILIDVGFNIPLYFERDTAVFSKGVKGYQPTLLGKPRFDGVSLSGN